MEIAQETQDIKVLLVDDEINFASILKRRLGVRRIHADVAYDGFEALSYLERTRPDVMLLDLRMPGMDGIEVLKRTKAIYPELPIIIVTGHGNHEDEEEVKRLGGYAFLRKPLEIENLTEKIREACLYKGLEKRR
jgi:DNA-binding NtrC family response regulator